MGWVPMFGLGVVFLSGMALIVSFVRDELKWMRHHGLPMPWDDE